jgi:hypothetical protein
MRLAVIATVLTTATAASAEPLTARLDVRGACELTSVEARSNELLERAAILDGGAARFTVDTTSGGGTVSATVTFFDANGTAWPARTITASTCEDLAGSVAIVISLVLRQDSQAPARRSSAPPPEAANRAAAAAPLAPERAPDEQRAPDRGMRTVVDVGAAARSSHESALLLGVRRTYRRLAFGLALDVSAPTTTDLGVGSVHVLSARLDATVCAHAGGFAICGLAVGGLVRASGDDLMGATSAVRPVAALGTRLEWRQSVSRRFGVRVFADLEQLVATTRFLVDDTAVWTSPPRQAALGAGVFLRVP